MRNPVDLSRTTELVEIVCLAIGLLSNDRSRSMEVTASYLGDSRFEVTARGHRLISDQPTDNGGADTGPTPPELLLASLASCAAYYAAQYLNTRKLPARDLKVQVSAEKAQQPTSRLGAFRIQVSVPGLDQRHQAGLLRAVKACLIHNTLAHPSAIDIVIHSPALAA